MTEKNFNTIEEKSKEGEKINSIDFPTLIAASKLNDIQKFALSKALVKSGGVINRKAVQAFAHCLDRSIKDKTIIGDKVIANKPAKKSSTKVVKD